MWNTWQCSNIIYEMVDQDDTDLYNADKVELFEWAHMHGCLCTCSKREKRQQRERVMELQW
jgi:hypothetical protein